MKQYALKFLLVLGCVLSIYFMGLKDGVHKEYTRLTELHQTETKRLKEARDEVQSKLDGIAKRHAEDAQRSESLAAGTVAELRDRGIRLSVKLANTKREAVEAYNRGLTDGRAELHPETAEALVRITQDADRHVKALQETLREVTNE